MLLSLLSEAQLPWSAGKSEAECLRMKKNTDIAELTSELGCPLVRHQSFFKHERERFQYINCVNEPVPLLYIDGGVH